MLLIGANRGRKLREGWTWRFHQHGGTLASKAPLHPGTRVGTPGLGTPSGLGTPPVPPCKALGARSTLGLPEQQHRGRWQREKW